MRIPNIQCFLVPDADHAAMALVGIVDGPIRALGLIAAQPQCIGFAACSLAALACRSPQIVRTRLSSPALATMPWKYPPGDVRKCSVLQLSFSFSSGTEAASFPVA